ncbi:MAG: alkaline phosphatase [Puniceicoccaceae bacterium]|nr:MAG: alkaline phosphatase [Puniceicoccaceae bacterium]
MASKEDTLTPKQNIQSVSRRNFLKASGLGLALVGSAGLAPFSKLGAVSGANAGAFARGKAKNIIFLVSDGMSAGTFSTADQYMFWKEGRHTHWGELFRSGRGRFSMMETSSRNSLVTDSGAGSSAWGCGHRVNNGRINMDASDNPLKPILAIARDAGKATGLVTTATISHATPAGFAANMMSRNDEREILEQYLERDYDLLLGGGHSFIEGNDQRPSLHPKIETGGYEFIRDRASLLASERSDPRLIGLFSDGHIPFEVDRVHSSENLHESVPSLAEMTEVALRRLSSNPNGFLVQIEGARVDHAAHLNDLGGLLFDQLAFDDAVGVALKFIAERDDTLLIVTTDHGNASPGMSSGQNLGGRNLRRMSGIRGSYHTLRDRLDPNQSVSEVQKHVADVLGQEIRDEHAEYILRHRNSDYEPPYERMRWVAATVGQIMANYHDFGWIGNAHTAEYVYLTALGPGSESVQPFTKNTDLFDLMVRSAGMEAWLS